LSAKTLHHSSSAVSMKLAVVVFQKFEPFGVIHSAPSCRSVVSHITREMHANLRDAAQTLLSAQCFFAGHSTNVDMRPRCCNASSKTHNRRLSWRKRIARRTLGVALGADAFLVRGVLRMAPMCRSSSFLDRCRRDQAIARDQRLLLKGAIVQRGNLNAYVLGLSGSCR
jgi:hypothetical protein